MKKITIIITDDHKLIRQSLSLILNADSRFQVVAEVGSGEKAVEQVRQMRPNVVIMDISLPGISGMEATQLIRKLSPTTKILAVSMYTQPVYVSKMLKQGAMGYVTKNSSSEEMCKAVFEIQSNRRYLCNEIKNIISDQLINGDENKNGFNSISQREIEIIGYIKEGYSSKETADFLMVSSKTVEVHRYNILRKLKLKNTAAMVNYINSSQLATIH